MFHCGKSFDLIFTEIRFCLIITQKPFLLYICLVVPNSGNTDIKTTLGFKRANLANIVTYSIRSDARAATPETKVQCVVGLLKHSFIVLVEPQSMERWQTRTWRGSSLFLLSCLLCCLHALFVVLLSKAHVPQEFRVDLRRKKEKGRKGQVKMSRCKSNTQFQVCFF